MKAKGNYRDILRGGRTTDSEDQRLEAARQAYERQSDYTKFANFLCWGFMAVCLLGFMFFEAKNVFIPMAVGFMCGCGVGWNSSLVQIERWAYHRALADWEDEGSPRGLPGNIYTRKDDS